MFPRYELPLDFPSNDMDGQEDNEGWAAAKHKAWMEANA